MDEDSLSIIEEEMEQLEVSASGETQCNGGSVWGKNLVITWALLRQLECKAV